MTILRGYQCFKCFRGKYTLISYEKLSFVAVRIDERQPCMEDKFLGGIGGWVFEEVFCD